MQTESIETLKNLRKENDIIEKDLKKDLQVTKNELESLKGEFQVKMQKIRLTEMKTENSRIEYQEKNESMDIERAAL